MRSFRQTRQLLLVVGTTGLTLGTGLAVFFLLRRNMMLVRVGIVYILLSAMLLGIRGVLGHLDELNKRRRTTHRARQAQNL